MSKQEMIEIVDKQVEFGLPREEAIRLLAFTLGEDDPENHAEMWFQQKIGGG